MKALTLAAVIALSATGAAALDPNEIITKGVKITEFDMPDNDGKRRKDLLYLYNGFIYYCAVDSTPALNCLTNLPTKPY